MKFEYNFFTFFYIPFQSKQHTTYVLGQKSFKKNITALLHLVYHTFVLPIWASSFLTIASTHDCGEAKWRKAGLSAACMARDGYSIHLSLSSLSQMKMESSTHSTFVLRFRRFHLRARCLHRTPTCRKEKKDTDREDRRTDRRLPCLAGKAKTSSGWPAPMSFSLSWPTIASLSSFFFRGFYTICCYTASKLFFLSSTFKGPPSVLRKT